MLRLNQATLPDLPRTLALTMIVLLAVPAPGLSSPGAGSVSGCPAEWVTTFGDPGANGPINAMVVFDDALGGGPALYAAGRFGIVGGDLDLSGGVGASNIARWDGAAWTPLGSGITGPGSEVYALAVFDDGAGAALYAGGFFTTAGGLAAGNIAKWNGTSWSPLGSGTDDAVFALAGFDDGTGPALYAGGLFTTAGGSSAAGIARWRSGTWSAVGGGPGAEVLSLAVFDDGGGSALHAACGGYSTTGFVARWRSGSWTTTGNVDGVVATMALFDDGGGEALYAGGQFFEMNGNSGIKGLAKWNGTSWAAVGPGTTGLVLCLQGFDDGLGGGPRLYAGGLFSPATNMILTWDGASLSQLGPTMNGQVSALAVFDDGDGQALFAGGQFQRAGGEAAFRIARWNPGTETWSPLGAGGGGLETGVMSLAIHDDGLGGGPALYAGGLFLSAGGESAARVARWDGDAWSPLGAGLDRQVNTLVSFNDGSGPALYAGGEFLTVGGVSGCAARWNGAAWSPVGNLNGNGWINTLVVFDDGTGPALYAGGGFTVIGGVSANRVARWDGMSWSPLGSGMNCAVIELAVFDDGTGPALYAAGCFSTAGGVAATNIARWDGVSWSPLGSGLTGLGNQVHSLAVFDDGTGEALYAGGSFTIAGGLPANNIAKWNGTSWSALGSGVSAGNSSPQVGALHVFDDGSGPKLYAGGSFTLAGGAGAGRIAAWDGASWSPLGSGLSGTATPAVRALATYDDDAGDGTPAALYAAGTFTQAGSVKTLNVARWQGCPPASGVNPTPIASRLQAYPNPFATRVLLRAEVPQGGSGRIEIFDVRGRLVHTLLNGAVSSGIHEWTWNGRDPRGGDLPPGLYFLRTAGVLGHASRKIVKVE
jgi:hypothetical protein